MSFFHVYLRFLIFDLRFFFSKTRNEWGIKALWNMYKNPNGNSLICKLIFKIKFLRNVKKFFPPIHLELHATEHKLYMHKHNKKLTCSCLTLRNEQHKQCRKNITCQYLQTLATPTSKSHIHLNNKPYITAIMPQLNFMITHNKCDLEVVTFYIWIMNRPLKKMTC